MVDTNHLAATHVETLTRELESRLLESASRYRPSLSESLQDWLMEQMSRDPVLKSRLLRFVDVVAALDFERNGTHLKRLFREYFSGTFPRSSGFLRIAFFFGRQWFVPSLLVAGITRSATYATAKRFIVGNDSGSIHASLAYLERHGRHPTLALLGEEVLSEYEAEQFNVRYLQLINYLSKHNRSGRDTDGGSSALQLSIKLTSLTENFNPADPEGTLKRVGGRLEEIARCCAAGKIGLTIDAEQFERRELTWHVFSKIFGPGSSLGKWDGVGLTVQSYFRDSEAYLRTVLQMAEWRGVPFQVRLVKGAYWEYEVIMARHNGWPVPVFEQKQETDRAFQRMLSTLIEYSGRVKIAVASHNTRDHAYAEALREAHGLPPVIEHQTLFRTAEGISRAVHRMGWESRDYVPCGELVPGMDYLVRRIQENTSPVGFLRRSRMRIQAGELLLTEIGDKPGVVNDTSNRTATGFRNNPPKRLFVAGERKAFESALAISEVQWGQDYPLKLGNQSIKTQEVKPSLSPSRPDPKSPVGLVHLGGVKEAERAVNVARQGFVCWSAVSAEERSRILTRAAGLMANERDTLAAWVVHEGGRTWSEALADVDEAVDHLGYNAHRLNVLQSTIEESYQPRGIVVVISPWNFPVALPAGMLSGALAAGNAVILKSAEQTPIIAARMVEILHTAGIPVDTLVHIPGRGDVGAHMVASPRVDMVAFTGSKAVGLSIVDKASSVPVPSAIKKVVAEMGGKNPIIVFPDADIDEAVRGILLSAFEHASQKCSACSRVFVHRTVMGRLRQRLVRAVTSLPVGPADEPGTLINPLIEPEARERVLTYARRAQEEGKILVNRIEQDSSNPLQVGPLVVELDPADVSRATIAQEEIFGPILTIVPFENVTEMLAQVNSTQYALTAGVFSRSPATIARMTRDIQAGNIYVNRKTTGAWVGVVPFGGFKLSGTGPKAGGPDYLFAFLKRRSGYRQSSTSVASTEGTCPPLADKIGAWAAKPIQRWKVLDKCVHFLKGECFGQLLQALCGSYGLSLPEAEYLATQLISVASSVVAAAPEVVERETTINLPGEKNYISWETPRGRGFIATDDFTPADRFAGMVFGPLLAGNGLILAPGAKLHTVASVLAACLYRAGVPHTVLAISESGGPEVAVLLANQMFHFAVTDLPLEQTQRVYQRLGSTRETEGQNWVKTLISLPEVPHPGEPGFARLFALPKTIVIRTLRHGAELDMPTVNS